MKRLKLQSLFEARSIRMSLLACAMSVLCGGGWAATQSSTINSLTFTDTLSTPFSGGDTLILDTLITNGSTGPLSQSVTFTVGPDVIEAIGEASWHVSTATLGPRLVGVDVTVFDASNNPVFTDTNTTVTNRVATSSLAGVLTPGTYKLLATGNAIRDVQFDVSLSFVRDPSLVPEPQTIMMLITGLGAVAFALRRRRPI
jgi:PEP-CTERM motif